MQDVAKELKRLRQTVLDPLKAEAKKVFGREVPVHIYGELVESETKQGLDALVQQAVEGVALLVAICQARPALAALLAKEDKLSMIDILPGKTRKVAYSNGVLFFVVDTKASPPMMASAD